ncbi:hypothetical protein Tco_0456028 [Tanacetum coccineum]
MLIQPDEQNGRRLVYYEVEIAEVTNIPCDVKKEDDSEQQMSHESDNDMEYDPSDARGDDKVELTDDESSDSDDEDEVAKIFRIETNVFDFDTPLYRAFKEFNYLLQIDLDMCHGCMKYIGRRMEYGRNQLQLNIIESHLIIKVGVRSGLPVAGKMMDIDGKLKEEALNNKAIMDGLIDEDDESSNEGWKRWDNFDNTNRDNE